MLEKVIPERLKLERSAIRHRSTDLLPQIDLIRLVALLTPFVPPQSVRSVPRTENPIELAELCTISVVSIKLGYPLGLESNTKQADRC
jgi:hypothetical protein